MKLPAKTPTLEGIDEVFHPLYTKDGDGYRLTGITPVDGYGVADTQGLKSSLESERTKAKNGEKILKKLGFTFDGQKNDFDGDLDGIQANLDNWDRVKDIDTDKEADRLAEERVAARVREKEQGWQQSDAKKEKKIELLTGIVEREMKTNRLKSGLAAHDGNPLLVHRLEDDVQFRPVEGDNGELKDFELVVISKETGGVRFSQKEDAGPTQRMEVEELIETDYADKPEYAPFFGSKQKGGDGDISNSDPTRSSGAGGGDSEFGTPDEHGVIVADLGKSAGAGGGKGS